MPPDLFRPPNIFDCSRPIVSAEVAALLANPPWMQFAASLMPRLPDVFGKTYRLPSSPYAGVDFVPPARK